MKRIVCIGALLVSYVATAQVESHGVRFEAAVVRPSDTSQRPRVNIQRDRLSLSAITLRDLILLAYDLKPFMLSGGPAWMDTSRFDISAVLDSGNAADKNQAANRERILEALRYLLHERFHLKTLEDDKDEPIYALTIAETGLKVIENKDLPDKVPGGFSSLTETRWVRKNVHFSDLASFLTGQLGTLVKDETSATGVFSFILDWQRDPAQGTTPEDQMAANLAPLKSALHQQLGVDLKRSRGKVRVLMVEDASKPEAN